MLQNGRCYVKRTEAVIFIAYNYYYNKYKTMENSEEITRKEAIKKMGRYASLTALGTFMILTPKSAQAQSPNGNGNGNGNGGGNGKGKNNF